MVKDLKRIDAEKTDQLKLLKVQVQESNNLKQELNAYKSELVDTRKQHENNHWYLRIVLLKAKNQGPPAQCPFGDFS